jgi:hypothetical protein
VSGVSCSADDGLGGLALSVSVDESADIDLRSYSTTSRRLQSCTSLMSCVSMLDITTLLTVKLGDSRADDRHGDRHD